MKKKFITAYQIVMSVLLIALWISMAVDGRLQTFDGGQWGIMTALSIAALFAVIMLQSVKNDMEKELYELKSFHEDAVDYEYEDVQPPADYEEPIPHILSSSDEQCDYWSRLPEHVLVSTALHMEETYMFCATEDGEVINWSEIGGLAKRWGDENWTDADATIAQLNTPEHIYVFVKDLPTKDDASLKHRLYKRIDKADAELSSFEAEHN